MITPERAELYKKQALSSVAARAKNPAAPGITSIMVTPHDVLDLLACHEELQRLQQEETAKEGPHEADGT